MRVTKHSSGGCWISLSRNPRNSNSGNSVLSNHQRVAYAAKANADRPLTGELRDAALPLLRCKMSIFGGA